MTSRRPEPAYKDLARRGATLTRTISPDRCPRLGEQCISLGPLNVTVEFGFDEHARMQASCKVTARSELRCHLCLEPKPWAVAHAFEVVLATSDEQAQQWARDDEQRQTSEPDIVVVAGAEVDLVELIEDELLLALPTVVCEDSSCEHRPALAYGAQDEAAVESGKFAALGALQERLRDESRDEHAAQQGTDEVEPKQDS